MTHGDIHDFSIIKKESKAAFILGDGQTEKTLWVFKDLIEALVLVYQNANERLIFDNVGVEIKKP